MDRQKTVIIGASQMGQAIRKLLNNNKYEFLCYGDNKQRCTEEGKLTVSVEEAISMGPDLVYIAVKGKDRTCELTTQIRNLGYDGKMILIDDSCELYDVRASVIRSIASRIESQNIEGAVAELGVYKGDTAWQINLAMPDRTMYLFDTFNGFDERDVRTETAEEMSRAAVGDFADTSEQAVTARMPHPAKVIVRKGWFPDTAMGLEDEIYALVSMDADLYEPTAAGLEYFYPRLNSGGVIVLHDYDGLQYRGVMKAVREYEDKHGRLLILPVGDLHGSCIIIKP